MSELGHNLDAVPLAERAREDVLAALVPFEERRDAIIASSEKAFVTDEDSTGRAGDLLGMIKSLRARCESLVDDVRQPIEAARGAINRAEETWWQKVDAQEFRVRALIEDYRAAQRALVQQRRADQAVAQAKARAAAAARDNPLGIGEPLTPAGMVEATDAAPVILPKVRGDYGSVVSDRAKVQFRIIDVRQIPDEVLLSTGVTAALMKALTTYHRLKPEIPGVEVIAGATSTVRK